MKVKTYLNKAHLERIFRNTITKGLRSECIALALKELKEELHRKGIFAPYDNEIAFHRHLSETQITKFTSHFDEPYPIIHVSVRLFDTGLLKKAKDYFLDVVK